MDEPPQYHDFGILISALQNWTQVGYSFSVRVPDFIFAVWIDGHLQVRLLTLGGQAHPLVLICCPLVLVNLILQTLQRRLLIDCRREVLLTHQPYSASHSNADTQ